MSGRVRRRSTGVPVRQLIVPESVFLTVSGKDGALEVGNNFGRWHAYPGHRVHSGGPCARHAGSSGWLNL